MNEKLKIKSGCGDCSRRSFIKNLMLTTSGLTFGAYSVIFQSCSPPTDNDDIPEGVFVSVDLNDSQNAALRDVGGTLALSGNDLDSQGILLYRESEDLVLAFSRKCTHAAVTIEPFAGGVSTCPEHGSQFNTAGDVVSGPASSGLRQYTTDLQDNTLIITA